MDVVYKQHLPEMLNDYPNKVFIQDNAKIHTIKETMEWLASQKYTIMQWPKYSPNLNPIEMVWKRIKNMVHTKHPKLTIKSGSDDSIKDTIVAAVIEAWEELDEKWLWNLTMSMFRRVAAVLIVRGSYTQY